MTKCPPLAAMSLVLMLAPVPLAQGQWKLQDSGTRARFRGLSVVSPEVVWAGGTEGTFSRTTDGGKTWHAGHVPDASDLDFRDVQAFDDRTAFLLAAGEGDHSRLFKTTDGGATWTQILKNPDAGGFLDAMAFWDLNNGLILGDPVDGRFVILLTTDGGKHWSQVRPEGMPPALIGEGAFAASGTCLTVYGRSHAWFGTGGGKTARIFRTNDGGRSWTVHATPVRAGAPTSGIFSVAFADADQGVVVGGDYKQSAETRSVVALTSDGGRTWKAPPGVPPEGFRSAVAFLPGKGGKVLVAVGPSGSDVSIDGGESWRRLGNAGFHALGFAEKPLAGWASGDNGTIASFLGPLAEK
jgi:photosystem II stability/assembly factor-like uncharacterized protein